MIAAGRTTKSSNYQLNF